MSKLLRKMTPKTAIIHANVCDFVTARFRRICNCLYFNTINALGWGILGTTKKRKRLKSHNDSDRFLCPKRTSVLVIPNAVSDETSLTQMTWHAVTTPCAPVRLRLGMPTPPLAYLFGHFRTTNTSLAFHFSVRWKGKCIFRTPLVNYAR